PKRDWSSDVCSSDLRFAKLLGVAQGFQQQAIAARSDRYQIFLAAHGRLADAGFLRRFKRLADDDIALRRDVVGGNQVIGPFEIAGRDIAVIDELRQSDAVLGLELGLVWL